MVIMFSKYRGVELQFSSGFGFYVDSVPMMPRLVVAVDEYGDEQQGLVGYSGTAILLPFLDVTFFKMSQLGGFDG